MLEHRVEDDEKLAHTGGESQFLRLAAGQQSLVEAADDGVAATGYQRSHVQGSSNSGAPTPDGAFAPQGATVPVEGSHTDQGGDLPAVQGAQLRQVGQEGERDLLSNTRDGAQEVVSSNCLESQ